MSATDLLVMLRVVADPADVPRKPLPANANEADAIIAELERDKAQLQFQLRLALQRLAQRN